MKLALKVDVDTWRGTRDGVPRLVELLKRHGAGATFLFSLGPDHTGRAMKRVFRKNFLSKVSRTSVLRHYGLRTLLYGTLLPGPDIGRRGASAMRAVRAAGFEVGVHCWDHVRWQDGVAFADADWTEREMRRARERFTSIFRQVPKTWGAAAGRPTAMPRGSRSRTAITRRIPAGAARSGRCGTGSRWAARNCRPRCRRSTS